MRNAMLLSVLVLTGCDDRALRATAVEAELRPTADPMPPEEEEIEETFAVVGALDGVPFTEATAYAHVAVVHGRLEIVGLDVLGDSHAGCDDRSKWVTNHGAFELARAGTSWSARIHAYDDELPCPGGPDTSFGLSGGHASIRFDDERPSALLPGRHVEGQIELETGKGAHPSASLRARFRARVCKFMR